MSSQKPVYRRMTNQIMRAEYFPGLQQIANLPWHRDMSNSIARNLKFAIEFQKDFHNRRLAMLRSYTEVDEKGNIAQEKVPDPNQPGAFITKNKFRSPDAEKTYVEKLQSMDMNDLFSVKVVLVDKRRMPDVEVPPMVIAMLEPMWMETDDDEVDVPLGDGAMKVVTNESEAVREQTVPIITKTHDADEQRAQREPVSNEAPLE